MALHTDLPIYKSGAELLGLAFDVTATKDEVRAISRLHARRN